MGGDFGDQINLQNCGGSLSIKSQGAAVMITAVSGDIINIIIPDCY